MVLRKSLVGLLSLVATTCCAGLAIAQPANNACSNSTALTVGANSSVSVIGSTIGATNDSSSGNCYGSNTAPDVWYTVNCPANGTLTADTCFPDTDYPTVVSFRTGAACPGGTILACNETLVPCPGGGMRVSLQASAATVYRIRVSGVNGAAGGFRLTVSHSSTPNPALGPDVITAVVTDMMRYGIDAGNTVAAYAVGTTSCNPGDFGVIWIDNTTYAPDYNVTQHPVISQNMFRLKSYGAYSRFEQLGQGWLKHGFVSTNSSGCGGCAPNSSRIWRFASQTYQGVAGDALGVNCSDTYGASLNGSQSGLGAKNIVNPTLGTSAFVTGNGTGDATARERIQVPVADVTAQPAGTRFFAEGCYVTADDAQFVRPGQTVAINGLNNASYREISAGTINAANPGFVGATVTQKPAIFAWRAADAGVTLVSADHDDMPNPGTGYRAPNGQPQNPVGTTFVRSRFWVAGKATALPDGLWRYEYAVYNLNSDRGAGSFSLPFPENAPEPTDFAFRAPQYHSGEPYSNAPWTMTKTPSSVKFSTQPFAANANASAIRWGNLFNFGFTCTVPPDTGSATIVLFKPGTIANAPASIPAAGLPVPSLPLCAADFNFDRRLDPDDISDFVTAFFATPPAPATDFNRSGVIDPDDLSDYIAAYFQGC